MRHLTIQHRAEALQRTRRNRVESGALPAHDAGKIGLVCHFTFRFAVLKAHFLPQIPRWAMVKKLREIVAPLTNRDYQGRRDNENGPKKVGELAK